MASGRHLNGVFGVQGPRHPRLAGLGTRVALPLLERLTARAGLVAFDSKLGQSRLTRLASTISDGRPAYVLGLGLGFHNSGAALVRISARGTVELICNEEEERYTGVKNCTAYPEHSIAAIKQRMDALGIGPASLAACVGSWNYAQAITTLAIRPVLEEAPASMPWRLRERSNQAVSATVFEQMRTSASRLARQLGHDDRLPIVGMRHHDNHAYFSYAVSPFADEPGPTMVIVLDGAGDDATASFYQAEDGRLTLLNTHGVSTFDSLGRLYGFLSSTQGGWPILSSEGRYMGAAAWGDGSRLTNRYYRRLRQIVHFGTEGEVTLNRALANWTRGGWTKPYTRELIDILGEPIPVEKMWHPDQILDVEHITHPAITRDRVDKAAAVQMVFEDALVHLVEYMIRLTASSRLVLTGGTALNCVANMRLLACFDECWYDRQLGRGQTFLNLWVPPMPGDASAPVGAAYAFAMRAGARPGPRLRHAFYCGPAPAPSRIRAAVASEPTTGSIRLGDCSRPERRALVADLLAHALAHDRVIGVYQGVSETGPRALGHRSILANPCNPDTRRLINERVKHRELIRPLAPMVTKPEAERLFYLHPGASADDYNAYNYMVLTARARPVAHDLIPAVIHHDGTARLQIVRPDVDAFSHDLLVAMGRRLGVEASVNTSLNVGAPMAHTPEQAVSTLKRARGMDGLLMIDRDQSATLVWLKDRVEACERLMESIHAWVAETDATLPEPLAVEQGVQGSAA